MLAASTSTPEIVGSHAGEMARHPAAAATPVQDPLAVGERLAGGALQGVLQVGEAVVAGAKEGLLILAALHALSVHGIGKRHAVVE